ncbi:MAG: HepT-like ribonuclease domain-containing protein [Acidobacteriota bacterium]
MKDDRVYLQHILRCIARIEVYTTAGRESFFGSSLIQDGVIRNLQILAESTQRLSEHVKSVCVGVDWKALAGFRNVLVHDYLGIDLEQVYRVVEQDVPNLRLACETVLAGLERPEE